jgi:Icc protein
MKIIQVTDCHIRPRGEKWRGIDPSERLRIAIRSINELHGDADLCVFTGDLTDRGDVREYQELRDCLSALRVRYCLLVGNHDRRAAFRSVFPEASVDENGFVQSVVESNGHALVMLDTLEEKYPSLGGLCQQRLGWLRRQIQQRPGARILVFMHHPPISIGVPYFEAMLLANREEFFDLISSYPNVEHIAFGHAHMTLSGWRGRVSYSSNRGTFVKIGQDFEKMVANLIDAGPSYSVLLVGKSGTVIHSVDPAGPIQLIAREFPLEDGTSNYEFPDAGAELQLM